MTKYKKEVEVSIPQAYDLGFCSINHTSSFPFTIFNPNLKPISYLFKFTEFAIVPSKGTLMPNSMTNFKIEFKPTTATVIVGTVVLEVEGEPPRVFRLSAVGKYPYISIKEQTISFPETLVTKQVFQEVVLNNSSEVEADFCILPEESQFPDNFFSVHPNAGKIPPKKTFAVKFFYSSKFVDNEDVSKFKMICESGNELELFCKGSSKKFEVSLNSSSMNFGEVKLDSMSSKALTITNSSELDADFEFFTESGNIFNFSEVKGSIAKESAKKIIISFNPRNTIAYYERVYCIVRNHILLYVDLIGTCYDLLIRPIPLLQVHIDSFRKRVIEGRISEIELKYVENNALLRMAKRKELGEDYNGTNVENFYKTVNSTLEHPFMLHKELFLENQNNQLISISENFLEFGFCELMTISGHKEIIITNKLQCKLSLYWVSQKRENMNGEFMTVFQVFPESATLKPNTPTKFTISFRPLKANSFFFQNLQFYAVRHSEKVNKKTLEEFEYREIKSKPENTLLRNVKLNQTIQSKVREELVETEVFPSISGSLKCSGNSFSQSTMPFLPIVKINPPNGIVMKPSLIHDSTYETLKLSNPSDTPIHFKIGPEMSRAFRFYPRIGIIEPKSFCIIGVEFSPKEYKTYQSTLNVILNDMPGSSNLKISLLGICTEPEIKLQDEGKIFFAPTSIGVFSKKSFSVENLSKNRLTYKISVPEKYESEIYFEPNEKELLPNENLPVQVFFAPGTKRKYKFKVPVTIEEVSPKFDLEVGYYRPGSGLAEKNLRTATQKEYEIEVIGEGSDGNMLLSEEEVDFGAVKITEHKKMVVKLINKSDCAFYVEICLKNANAHSNITDSQINNAFKLDFKGGSIPGNSEIAIGLTFAPSEIADFDLQLVVQAKEKVSKKVPIKMKGLEPLVKCKMRIKSSGNYPQLEIIDIRNDTLSVASLWENFQISQINQALNTNLSTDEKMFLSIENLTFSETKNLQSRLKNYEWNLGYVSAKSKDRPRKVIITVRNYGGTTLDYNFKFPSDNKIEEELWADPGEPSEEEAYEKAILDKNIFIIKPKVGHLEPGEVKDIELIYSPTALDFSKSSSSLSEVHMLKVIFQIQNGKSLIFNLKGTTLGPNEGLLTVKKTHYDLPFAPIGLLTPLRFPVELNNVGSIKVTYKSEIEFEDNFSESVFKIENPTNFLIPGENTYLYVQYKPLVKREYSFKVNIEVLDFAKPIQRIELFFVGDSREILQEQNASLIQSIPRQRTSVSEVGSKVFFSIEDLDFGKMKPNTTKYRMIIMYNMSKDKSLSFDFNPQVQNSKTTLTCGDKFLIEPSSGTVEANNFLEIKLTLISVRQPSIYEGEIACNVTWNQTGYSIEDNDVTLKDTALKDKKETLFLRIKKQTDLNNFIDSRELTNISGPENEKKSVLETVFGNIFSSILNDPALIGEIKSLEQEKFTLLDQINCDNPAWQGLQIEQQGETSEDTKDFAEYQNLFLKDEFQEITELIMENTFFNIMQETTHKENDFLRVSKKFVNSNTIN